MDACIIGEPDYGRRHDGCLKGEEMVIYEDECVGCRSDFGNCLGGMCPNRNVPHCYCDECKDEADLYEFDGEELCIDCIEKRLIKVAV